jgi:hypothetical protein
MRATTLPLASVRAGLAAVPRQRAARSGPTHRSGGVTRPVAGTTSGARVDFRGVSSSG